MKPHLILLLATVCVDTALASIEEKPKRPGWPDAEYPAFVTALEKASLVVFDFDDGRKAFVTERKWIEAFLGILTSSAGKADAYCFCISPPHMKFMTEDGTVLSSIQLTHSNKVRFSGEKQSGDFILPADDHKALVKLMLAVKPVTVEKPKLPIPEKPKLDLETVKPR
jgi:hypothetical protein